MELGFARILLEGLAGILHSIMLLMDLARIHCFKETLMAMAEEVEFIIEGHSS